MNNWALQYSGGSGGFLLLHLLLLSNKFYAAFDRDISLNQIIQEHWNIKSPEQWKSTEIWPNTQATLDAQVEVNKIYFQCNPFDNMLDIGDVKCKKIVIYTDYRSQQLLSHYKKANWWYTLDLKYYTFKTFLKTWQTHYTNVKDPSWPKCLSIRHLHRLPEIIQKEILADPHIEYFLNFKYQEPSALFNNDLVHDLIVPYLESADVVVKLQDLVNSDGKILETLFDIPKINNKQSELLKKWKQLHNNTLLSAIGISA